MGSSAMVASTERRAWPHGQGQFRRPGAPRGLPGADRPHRERCPALVTDSTL